MKLQLKTLSPLHIGNGEKYNGLSYVQDKRQSPPKVCYLEFDIIRSVLTDQQLQNFADWVAAERFPTLYKFLRNNLNDRNNSIANSLISKSLYKIDQLFKEDYQQRRFLGDIETFIKQNNRLYIPGTEVKGAIRTAVIYKLLQKDENWNWLKEKLYNFKRQHDNSLQRIPGQKSGLARDIKKQLVKEMSNIEGELQTKLLRVNNHTDAKYDLLKMLYIGDTHLKEPSQCLFISDLKTLNINRQFSLFQEFCKKDQTFTCQGFKLDNNKIVLDKLGFSPEQKFILSDIKNLFQCCYEFSKKLLDEEITYNQFSADVKNKLKAIKAENKPDSPVIRIGKNEGYLSFTMGFLVKERDKTLYDHVLCHATKNTSYTGNYPKTRRVVNLRNGDQDTCGWIKLNYVKE